MEVEQVDVVALQASQALLAGAANVSRREVLRGRRIRLQERIGVEVVAGLGGDDEPAAAPAQRACEQLLAVAAGVDVRRVEQVDAQVDCLTEQSEGLALVPPGRLRPCERPHVEPDGGDLNSCVCYAAVFHHVCRRSVRRKRT